MSGRACLLTSLDLHGLADRVHDVAQLVVVLVLQAH
ncbi:MAG: hypothetical protein ACI9SE_000811, partial [Neolewinella sp.]